MHNILGTKCKLYEVVMQEHSHNKNVKVVCQGQGYDQDWT